VALCAWSAGCGGFERAPDGSGAVEAGTLADATASLADATALPDDATCADGCNDAAPTIANGALDASQEDGGIAQRVDDAADALSFLDVPADREVCRLVWPQLNYYFETQTPKHVAVDGVGNVFVAIDYATYYEEAGAPPIDLGVPLPSYATGFVIAKIDPDCHLLWVHDFGVNQTPNSSFETIALGVDENSNATVVANYNGVLDVRDEGDAGSVLATNPGVFAADESFMLRVDGSGKVVFARLFRANGDSFLLARSLVVAPDGVATLLAVGSDGADFGGGVVPDAGQTIGNSYFVRFGAAGNVLRVEVLPYGNGYEQLLTDPDGGLWAYGQLDSDAGGVTGGMFRVDATGNTVWSRPLDPFETSYGVNSTGEVTFVPSDVGTGTLAFYSADGTLTSSHTLPPDPLTLDRVDQILLDPVGNVFAGGSYTAADITHADGSFTYVPLVDAGAGYRRFDSTGAQRAMNTWGGLYASFGSMALAPNGDVIVLGAIEPPSVQMPPPVLFLMRYAPGRP
jgi:hypothetical protein